MDFQILLCIFIAFVFIFAVFLFVRVNAVSAYCENMAELLARTLEFYYKEENIKPFMINNGIDLVYNPSGDVSDIDWYPGIDEDKLDAQKGFITIWYQGADCKTPIVDVKDADILSEKIIRVVQKHIKDREMGVEK